MSRVPPSEPAAVDLAEVHAGYGRREVLTGVNLAVGVAQLKLR